MKNCKAIILALLCSACSFDYGNLAGGRRLDADVEAASPDAGVAVRSPDAKLAAAPDTQAPDAIPGPPTYVYPPKDCPEIVIGTFGIGAYCAPNTDACARFTDHPAIALQCSCDDYNWGGPSPPAEDLPPVDGMPCFCYWLISGKITDPNFCPQNVYGTSLVLYTLHPWPNSFMSACVPSTCAGLNMSR